MSEKALEDALAEVVVSVLGERVEPKLIKKAFTRSNKKKLFRLVIKEMFYTLLKNRRLNLTPGFGSLVLKHIKERDMKVFDKTSKRMIVRRIHGKKVVYIPGETIKEFL